MYFKGVKTKFNRPKRNEDVVQQKKNLIVFQSQYCLIGKLNCIQLDEKSHKITKW